MDHNPSLASDSNSAADALIPPASGRCVFDDLPTEVLMYIFSLGMVMFRAEDAEFSDSGSNVSGEVDLDELDLPWELLVSRICRRWRTTAIQTTSLWSTVKFTDDGSLTKQGQYLQRSKQSPLDVEIFLKDTDAPPTSGVQRLRDILSLLVPHVEHWRSFILMAHSHTLIARALTIFGACQSAPLLEALHLDCERYAEPFETHSQPSSREQDFIIFHGRVPKLRELTLVGAFLDWPRYHGLPKLISLQLEAHKYGVRPHYDDFVRILRESSNLTRLVICESGPTGKAKDWDPSPVVLPSIKTLELGHLSISTGAAFLERLDLPNLTNLLLDFTAFPSSDTLLNAFSSSKGITGRCNLSSVQILSILGLDCNKATIWNFYAATPNLRELTLNMGALRSSWYRYLAREDKDTHGVLCPKLETLHLVGVGELETYKLVKLRWKRCHSLKTLHLRTFKVFHPIDQLSEARQNWLHEVLEEFKVDRTLVGHRVVNDHAIDGASDATDPSTDGASAGGYMYNSDSDGLDYEDSDELDFQDSDELDFDFQDYLDTFGFGDYDGWSD